MRRKGFSCVRCGHCCRNLVDAYRGCVSDADLALWQREGRSDILAWVDSVDLGRGNVLHSAWVDPETRDDVERCPWLVELPDGGGYLCGINDVKPEHCRNYPEHRRHGEATGCQGFAVKGRKKSAEPALPCPQEGSSESSVESEQRPETGNPESMVKMES